MPRLDNPFYGDILGGIEQSAEERGYRLLIASTDVLGRTELQAVESLIHHRPAAYILCGPRDEAVATRLTARGLPVMIVDSHLAPPQAARIVIDDYVGMQLAVRHLIGLGHRRIAAVIDSEVDRGRHRRLAGYVDALTDAGLAHDDALRGPMPVGGRELRDIAAASLRQFRQTEVGDLGEARLRHEDVGRHDKARADLIALRVEALPPVVVRLDLCRDP